MRVFVAAVRRAFLEEDSDAVAHQATALSFIHLDDAAAGTVLALELSRRRGA